MFGKKKNYAKRDVSEYNNIFRRAFYWTVTRIVYNIRLRLVYNLKVNGKENIPKTNNYIVAPNHLSTLDPPLTGVIIPHFISYMTKQELFEIPFLREFIDYLGGFAVNREHLCPSTIKTARAISKTNWVLGLFPEGKRGVPGKIGQVSKGFAALAKATKCNILPIGITGTHEAKHIPFTGHVVANIGEIIPYTDDMEVITQKWIKSIEDLTGFKYEGE